MKRTKEMKIRFFQNELDDLTEKSKRSGLSRERFYREILNGAKLKEAPPVEYFKLIQEVRRTGYHINQLLKIANARGLLDVPLLRKSLEDNRETERMLWRVFQEEQ